MNILYEQSARLLNAVHSSNHRFLYHRIDWNQRLIGLKGARGTGKTTLLLQWLKAQNLPVHQAIYLTLDDIYFAQHSLKDTVHTFYLQGGKVVLLDEVHKYSGWAREIKNLYDLYPSLKIIFTASSIINIHRQEGDLSRRAVIYHLPGLSYREFLLFQYQISIPPLSLVDLVHHPNEYIRGLDPQFMPLQAFSQYLQYGYYPFLLKNSGSVHQWMNQFIRAIIEYDMSELSNFDIRNAKKMLQLIYLIAQAVPFKPNITELADKTKMHRTTLSNYLYFLEQAQLIHLLLPAGKSTATLQKPEKIYLKNTNLLYAMKENEPDIGTIRETFFLSQVSVEHQVTMPLKGDFQVANQFIFEVGGKNKTAKQIAGLKNAYQVKADVQYASSKELPLWLFGMLY